MSTGYIGIYHFSPQLGFDYVRIHKGGLIFGKISIIDML